MSLPPSATGSEGVTIVPPTPTSSAPPSLPEGPTFKKHSGEKVSPPPVQRAVDSGVALEEVLNQALSLKDGNGEEELKRAEEAAVGSSSLAVSHSGTLADLLIHSTPSERSLSTLVGSEECRRKLVQPVAPFPASFSFESRLVLQLFKVREQSYKLGRASGTPVSSPFQ
jgi:hypothetical protein